MIADSVQHIQYARKEIPNMHNPAPQADRIKDLAATLPDRDISLILWVCEQLQRLDEESKCRARILHHMQHIPADHLDTFLWVTQPFAAIGLNRKHAASKQ
ncbi:MAG: hypothetical protein IKC76_05690 [Firmicutes bacterium]|nr:hypothetical protein [Bacillota bacterium]